MTLKEFRYIVALAQERHFGRAAAKCFVSEPTMSVAIHKIEEELGVRLFERGKTHVVATEIGARIAVQAQRVLDEAALVRKVAHQGRDQLSGPLKLGVIPTIGPYVLPAVVPILRQRAPGMPLALEENITANLAVLLRRGALDAIILTLPFEEPGAVVLPLYDEPFKVVVPDGHRWENRRAIKASELESETVLLLHGGHCFRDQVLGTCPALSRPDADLTQGNSLEAIRSMVASGFGITVLPCSTLPRNHHARLLREIAFEGPVPSRRVALAWRKSFTRPEAIEVLRESIIEVRIPCLRMLPR
jgi:LysR family transcriptional regulator, hydrogen peroxide-inducible genes activator